MFGDSSQKAFIVIAFLRSQATNSIGAQTELAFVLCKACVATMKVMKALKLELKVALQAVRLKLEIC